MGKNHLAEAESELLRLAVSPKNDLTARRVLELKAIISEHRVGSNTTVFA